MNPETGKVYRGKKAIRAAMARGEVLVPISERAADIIDKGRQARRQGLITARQQRKQRKERARAARAAEAKAKKALAEMVAEAQAAGLYLPEEKP